MLRFNMQLFFTKTKLSIPIPRTKLVERPRLLDRLTHGFNNRHKLLLIDAPAGFGKTTLARAWITQANVPVAWYSLDRDDSNPQQFLKYLLRAIGQALPELADSLYSFIETPPQPAADLILTLLINELSAAGQPLVIVLDEYHHIESSQTDLYLAFLLEHLPKKVAFLLTTCTRPNLPLFHLRKGGQMTEITAEDLRFTPEEMEDFFQLNSGLSLSPALLEGLDEKTEGWAAGLQLVAMTFPDEPGLTHFLQETNGKPSPILDYLGDEVLSGQSQAMLDFLYATALLEQVCAPLAAALLDQEPQQTQALLETLERENLFIIALDRQHGWYRYHPLFRKLLQDRLEAASRFETPALRCRASIWFENEGRIDLAARHSLAAKDAARAAHLIEANAEAMLLAGNYNQYLHLVEQLPHPLRTQSPTLLIYQAAALLFNEHPRQAILDVLAQMDELTASGEWEGEISAIRAITQSYACQPEKGIELSKRALPRISPEHAFFRNLVERNLGVAYMLVNDLENANIWFEKLLISSTSLNDWGGMLAAYNHLAFIRKTQGRLHEAAEIYHTALRFIEQKGLRLMSHSIKIISGYGDLLLHWNRIEAAKAAFKSAIQLARKTNLLFARIAYQGLSEALLRENGLRGALTTIQELRYQAQDQGDLWQRIHAQHTLAMEAWIHLEAGRVDLAYAWLVASGFKLYSIEELSSRYGLELGYLLPIVAKITVAKGQPEAALEMLEAAIPKFRVRGTTPDLIRTLSAAAVTHLVMGNNDKAITALSKALTLAEPEENLGDFMVAGPPLVPLLYKALSAGVVPGFTRRLLAILAKAQHTRKAPAQDFCLLNPLSRREMDVLHLIAQGMTNREIATHLFLSTNTIKSHSIKIYRKLSVNSRGQAISKARLLGILPRGAQEHPGEAKPAPA